MNVDAYTYTITISESAKIIALDDEMRSRFRCDITFVIRLVFRVCPRREKVENWRDAWRPLVMVSRALSRVPTSTHSPSAVGTAAASTRCRFCTRSARLARASSGGSTEYLF